LFTSCTKIRESAGVTRKSIDEYQSVENPPLVIPPDFNLIPPDKLKEKNIQNVDEELAKEILFGLDEDQEVSTQNSSTINEILSKTKDEDISENIREEIDLEFANEKNTGNILNQSWDNEAEVLDAVKESERIRNSNFEGRSIAEGEIPVKTQELKKDDKKKKKFFFF